MGGADGVLDSPCGVIWISAIVLRAWLRRRGRDMKPTQALTGRLVAAGRALTGVSQRELANAAGMPLEAFHVLEASGAAWIPPDKAEALN